MCCGHLLINSHEKVHLKELRWKSGGKTVCREAKWFQQNQVQLSDDFDWLLRLLDKYLLIHSNTHLCTHVRPAIYWISLSSPFFNSNFCCLWNWVQAGNSLLIKLHVEQNASLTNCYRSSSWGRRGGRGSARLQLGRAESDDLAMMPCRRTGEDASVNHMKVCLEA